MLVGFGCNVPAIMAARTLDTRRDRLTTIMVLPLMSCSARLVIYTVLVAAFFPNRVLVSLGVLTLRLQPVIIFGLYALGALLAIAGAKLLRATVLRGETHPLVIELPPYRVPTIRGLAIHVWERSWLYVKKAGTIILGFSIVLWFLISYPTKPQYDHDYAARERRAAAEYVRGMENLAASLGIPADHAGELARLALADLAFEAARDRHFPHEAGFKAALRRYAFELAAARNGPAGDRIKLFLELRKQIAAVRDHFAGEVELHAAPEGSPEHFVLVHKMEARLAELKATAPGAYQAAIAWLDRIRPGWDAERQAIRRQRAAEDIAYSAAGRIGKAIEPLIRPLGFDWKIGTALLGAFGAREVFVAQMGIIYAVGSGGENVEALRQRLRADYSPLVGFCIMLFCLISLLCLPTLAVTRRETGSWRWAALQLGSLTALAYVLTFATYQLGRLFGLAG